MREKSQILVSHTGNSSIFAFAAEVEYHADAYDFYDIGVIRQSAIKADMSISSYDTIADFNTLVQEGILERIGAQVENHTDDKQYPDLLNEQNWAVIHP